MILMPKGMNKRSHFHEEEILKCIYLVEKICFIPPTPRIQQGKYISSILLITIQEISMPIKTRAEGWPCSFVSLPRLHVHLTFTDPIILIPNEFAEPLTLTIVLPFTLTNTTVSETLSWTGFH